METTTAPRFVLPGTWGRVDLASERTLQQSVRRILDTTTQRRDDLAGLRHELRGRFEAAAEAARRGGATDFYIAFKLTPTIPLPAWISVFTPRIDATDFAALGLDELAGFLDASTERWGDDAARRQVDGLQGLHAVRHSWKRVRQVSEGDVTEQFEFLEADYWLAAREPNRIALLTFSTALAEHDEQMLELFDAIIRTITWKVPSPEAKG